MHSTIWYRRETKRNDQQHITSPLHAHMQIIETFTEFRIHWVWKYQTRKQTTSLPTDRNCNKDRHEANEQKIKQRNNNNRNNFIHSFFFYGNHFLEFEEDWPKILLSFYISSVRTIRKMHNLSTGNRFLFLSILISILILLRPSRFQSRYHSNLFSAPAFLFCSTSNR